MTERAKPFVGWMTKRSVVEGWPSSDGPVSKIHREPNGAATIPVVVTPLLPGDPKPGEIRIADTFSSMAGEEVEVLSAPYGSGLVVGRPVKGGAWNEWHVSRLLPKPVPKTFRLNWHVRTHHDPLRDPCPCEIRAESKDAALARLAEMLEEVRP